MAPRRSTFWSASRAASSLLLTDIKMPLMDGIALALATARDYPAIIILLMTAYADQRERASNLDALIHDVILKPFTLAEITAAVSDALASKKQRRELEILEQPLDVVELELRPQRIGKAPAQLFQNAARALHVDLARHLDRDVVAIVASAQRTAERIGVAVGARLAVAAGLAGAARALLTLLHLLRQALRAAPQRLERAAL